jgi:hypothetical protein
MGQHASALKGQARNLSGQACHAMLELWPTTTLLRAALAEILLPLTYPAAACVCCGLALSAAE